MNRTSLYSGVTVAYLALASGGCATKGEFNTLKGRFSGLEGRVSATQINVGDIGQRVGQLERKPYAEGPVMIKRGQGGDELYGWLRGQVLPQFKDTKAREDAETNSNAITLVPTGVAGIYYGVVMRDTNDDNAPSKGDKTYPDYVNGKQKIQFIIDSNKLPEALKYMLLNVRSVDPKK